MFKIILEYYRTAPSVFAGLDDSNPSISDNLKSFRTVENIFGSRQFVTYTLLPIAYFQPLPCNILRARHNFPSRDRWQGLVYAESIRSREEGSRGSITLMNGANDGQLMDLVHKFWMKIHESCQRCNLDSLQSIQDFYSFYNYPGTIHIYFNELF